MCGLAHFSSFVVLAPFTKPRIAPDYLASGCAVALGFVFPKYYSCAETTQTCENQWNNIPTVCCRLDFDPAFGDEIPVVRLWKRFDSKRQFGFSVEFEPIPSCSGNITRASPETNAQLGKTNSKYTLPTERQSDSEVRLQKAIWLASTGFWYQTKPVCHKFTNTEQNRER